MEIDVYLQVIRRWIWLLVVMAVVAAGASFVLVRLKPTTYVAQVKLLVGPGVDNANTNMSILNASNQVMQTYANLATTQSVLQQVIDELHLDIGPTALASQITVTPDMNTGFLVIAVRSTNQKQAVAAANGLAKELVLLHAKKLDNGQNSSDRDVSAQVRQFEEQVARSQARIAQLEGDFKATSEAESQPSFVSQVNKIQALEAQLAAPIDPAVAKQMQDRRARIQQLEALLRSTVNVDARRITLDELAREDQTLQSQTAQLNEQKRLLMDQLGQERSRLDSMRNAITSQQNQILAQLGMERSQLADGQRNLSALYPALQNAAISQITIIDPAVNAPPETSRSTLIVLVAALAGLILAITLAFAFEYLDDKIRTPEQLEATGARVWGWIGRQNALPPPGRSKQGFAPLPDGRTVEAFRRLSIELMSNGSSRVSSLLIANFERGDTAAEIASNLAIMLTRSGKHVVLIDANLRQPALGKWFHVENKEGLTDWLSSGRRDPNLVPIEWAPGLSVLPAGTVNGNSPRELAWPRMADLIKRVESQTDMLIVSGPPLSTSADSLFLASHLGAVLAVAQTGRTQRALAGATIDNLRSVGIRVLGLILADGTKPHIKSPRQPEARQTHPFGKRLPSSAFQPQTNPKDKLRGSGTGTEARTGETSGGKDAESGTTRSNT
jgi:capsular polysaccharide biosynthesis protein